MVLGGLQAFSLVSILLLILPVGSVWSCLSTGSMRPIGSADWTPSQ
ncbi:MAG: hypothetical protein J07HB67_01808 [halophilic archaeon J07HB67]|nr:MAG: hypothetical protein J07HB67_01808 [halophilic archaeon J07HB67]